MSTDTAVNAALMQVLKTWKYPIGLANSEYNGGLIVAAIEKHFGNVFSHKNLDAAVVKLGDTLTWERGYSPNEVAQVWEEWWANHAPKNLLHTAANQAAIKAYLDKFFLGLVLIHNLNTASATLLPTLECQQEKTVDEKSTDFQKREFIRIQKEQQENSESAFFERAKKADERRLAEKEVKEQAIAEQCLIKEITTYEVYAGPNRVDHTKTNAARNDLFKIEVRRNGKRDAKLTLTKVREAIAKMP
jgi:hypothetical protein